MAEIRQAGYVCLASDGAVISICRTEKAAKRRTRIQAVVDPGAWYTETWYSEDDNLKEIHGRQDADSGERDADAGQPGPSAWRPGS